MKRPEYSQAHVHQQTRNADKWRSIFPKLAAATQLEQYSLSVPATITNRDTLSLILYLVYHSSTSSANPASTCHVHRYALGPSDFAKLLFKLLFHLTFPFFLPYKAARVSQECLNTSWISVFSEDFYSLLVQPSREMCLSWSGLPYQSLSGRR